MKVSASLSTATICPEQATSSARWPEHFRLTGPSRLPDPRTHAYRRDIADVELAGSLFAPHYARAVECHLATQFEMLRSEPSHHARAVSQLLRGEGFALLDVSGEWAWGRCAHDDYVGYLPRAALDSLPAPDQRISVPLAPIFAAPNFKDAVIGALPMGARFTGTADGKYFAVDGGYIHIRHADPLSARARDFVTVAERLIGQPYVWGGRGGGGIDCSGLTQLALDFAGIRVLRDSDQQQDTAGDPLDPDAALRRGDLLFFPGHVGIMADAATLLHANAYWMAVVKEPLEDFLARMRMDYAEPIVARRRLP